LLVTADDVDPLELISPIKFNMHYDVFKHTALGQRRKVSWLRQMSEMFMRQDQTDATARNHNTKAAQLRGTFGRNSDISYAFEKNETDFLR